MFFSYQALPESYSSVGIGHTQLVEGSKDHCHKTAMMCPVSV